MRCCELLSLLGESREKLSTTAMLPKYEGIDEGPIALAGVEDGDDVLDCADSLDVDSDRHLSRVRGICVCRPSKPIRERPKSVSLRWPFESIKRLSGLRSLLNFGVSFCANESNGSLAHR